MSESLVNWDDCLQVASISDVGMRRTTNQDNLCLSPASSVEQWQKRGHLFIVADGMGAHAAGELASKLAIDHIPHLYSKFDNIPATEALKKSVEEANGEIYRRGQANQEFHNMGTTCSVLALLPQGAVAAHVGDSRIYRLRKNRLEQLTFDHSLVWEMEASGQLTSAEQKAKIPKNVITRSLGPCEEVKVDLEGPFPVEVGDTFLLCSDGLTGPVTDAEIGSLLANLTPEEAVKVLVDLANLRGGPDNITIVVAKVMHPQLTMSDQKQRTTGGKKPRLLHPFSIAIFGVAVLLTILFWLMIDSWIAALIPGIVAIGSLIWMLVQVIHRVGDEPSSPQGALGRGPYTQIDCASPSGVVEQLKTITEQLQNGAEQQTWPIDFAQLKKMLSASNQAAEQKDFPSAIKGFSQAICWLMDQLRNNQEASSSSIDL